jgi:hypothetical protein
MAGSGGAGFFNETSERGSIILLFATVFTN